jgi:succinate dehydrogenase/fumarate reductase flavoprotein subunit
MPEPPHNKPRMHNVLPNSRAYPYYLERAAKRLNVDIRLNAPVVKFIIENDRVIGVVAHIDGVENEFVATGGVILASGDFSNAKDLKRIFKPEVENVDAINPSSTGDGQRMGMEIGSTVVNGEIVWGPSVRFKAQKNENFIRRLKPYRWLSKSMQIALTYLPMWMFRPFIMKFMTSSLAPEPILYKSGAILLNEQGKRFTNELSKPEFDIPKQSNKSAYIIFDNSVAKKFEQWPYFVSTAPGVAYAYLKDYKRTRSDIYFTANTIGELAEKMGIPVKEAIQSVQEYNKTFIKQGDDDERTLISQGPFHALGPVQAWIVMTEGGLAVNTEHQVLAADGRVINGLYAVGSAGQGGVILAGHGHHIGWAMTSGKRAGRFAAEIANENRRPRSSKNRYA